MQNLKDRVGLDVLEGQYSAQTYEGCDFLVKVLVKPHSKEKLSRTLRVSNIDDFLFSLTCVKLIAASITPNFLTIFSMIFMDFFLMNRTNQYD